MANWKKGATNAISSALAVAPTANPYLIGGAALTGGGIGLLTPERTFDESEILKALQKFNEGVRGSARRVANEAGSQTATRMATRGLGNSPVGDSIVAGQRRLELQRGEDAVNLARSNVHGDIATAKESIRQANEQDFRTDVEGLAQSVVALADNVATENSSLRELTGLPEIADPVADLVKAMTGQAQQGNVGNVSLSLNGNNNSLQPFKKPFLSKLSYESTFDDINNFLRQRNINANSLYGRAYHSNPARMQELEDAFGRGYLDNIFKWE